MIPPFLHRLLRRSRASSPPRRSSPSRRPPAAPTAPLLAPLLALLLVPAAHASIPASTLASTPLDAFVGATESAPGAAVLRAEAARRDAAAELQRARLGLGASLEVRPLLDYNGTFDGDPELDLGMRVGVDLGYRHDSAEILQQRLRLLAAEARLRDERRDHVAAALLLHAELVDAQVAVAQQERRLQARQDTLQRVREDADASTAQLQRATLDAAAEELDLETSRRRLATLQARAAALGFASPAQLDELLAFALPDASAEATTGYQQRLLALELAEVRALRARAFQVVDRLAVGASVRGSGTRVSTTVELDNGVPRANLGLDFPRGGNAWSVAVGATLRLDDRTFSTIADANEAVDEARAELAAFVDDYAVALDDARFELRSAELELDHALRSRAVNELRADELRARLADDRARLDELNARAERLREQRDAAEGDARRDLDAQLRDLERGELRDTQRAIDAAARELERLQDNADRDTSLLARAWRNQLRAVAAWLELTDGDWQLRETPPQ